MEKDLLMRMKSDAELINGALEAYLALHGDAELRGLTEAKKYSLLAGGKRIRPILTLAFCRLFGGEDKAALPFAIAVEMIHTASLIHDDLPAIDNDDLRRGRLTNHKVFGEANAILAADALFMDAFEIVAKNKNVAPEILVQAICTLSEATGTVGLVGGEYIDVASEGRAVSLETLKKMHSMKTGALIRAAAQLGALAAGISLTDGAMADAVKYSENIGLAFQIVDDVLDATGTAQELGKMPGQDEKEKKSTYLGFYSKAEALACADELTRRAVSAIEKYANSGFLCDLAFFLSARRS